MVSHQGDGFATAQQDTVLGGVSLLHSSGFPVTKTLKTGAGLGQSLPLHFP